MRLPARALAALLVVWSSVLPVARAGEGRAPAEFGSAITVVTLPVFVTDDAGRSVAELKAEDFEVQDDGKPMKLVGFQSFDAGDPATLPQLRSAPAARRQFLLLFDLSFTGVAGLVRAREAAHAFIDRDLRPMDLGAVATFSAQRGLTLLVGFTSDRSQLKKAIDTLGVTQLDRRADPLGLVYDLREVGSVMADTQGAADATLDSYQRAIQMRFKRGEEENYRQRILSLIEALGQLAKAMGAMQGRKQVIFLSAGFDETPLVGDQGSAAFRDSEAVVMGRLWEVQSEDRFGDSSVRTELEQTLRSFATVDAVVHSVDLSGLRSSGDLRTQQSGEDPHLRNGQESLSQIANLTGGKLFKDTNDVGRALSEVLEMSRRYYLLAFEPRQAKGAGAFHRLKVRVKGKGMSVSHRSGYFERQPFTQHTELAKRFEAAEVIAKGVTGGEIDVRALAVPYRAPGGRITLPVVLEVDGKSLLARKGGGDTLGLEVYGYALDENGGIEDVVALVSNVNMRKLGGTLRERGLQCHATFTLEPGRHSLRFLIRDAETGRSGAQWLDVDVPPFDPTGGVVLYPPLFMDDPGRWLILQAPSRSTPHPESPFRVASDPFAPRTRPRLANGRTESICLLAYDGGVHYDPGASFEIKAQLLDRSGAAVPMGAFRLERSVAESDGFRRFVLGLTPAGVSPGDYTFRVRLRDPASGRVSEAFQRVSVEATPE